MRKIPSKSINLFQLIYLWIREYESSKNEKVMNLSLGNPDLLPEKEVMEKRAEFQTSQKIEHHTYSEDQNINHYCEGLIEAFTGERIDLSPSSQWKALPTQGIKTATTYLPLACGLHLKNSEFKVVANVPAYDVVGTWTSSYLGGKKIPWYFDEKSGMRLDLFTLEEIFSKENPDLLFVIRPGNPCPVGATEKEWEEVIKLCIQYQVRLVNDGAYATLTNPGSHTPLIKVAKKYSDLEWAEMFSVSKSFSDPGARLGVIVGSKDFIEDWNLIKGNSDSGPVPSIMAGYGELLKDQKKSKEILEKTHKIYQERLEYLIPTVQKSGLKLACPTQAGFFTMWKTPDQAFGVNLREEAKKQDLPQAEVFHKYLVENTGIVGVHFSTPKNQNFLRFAVCTNVLDPSFQKRFEEALKKINPIYE